jgi:hypothetical protein
MAIHALTFVFGVWLFQQMRFMPSMWLAFLFLTLISLFYFNQLVDDGSVFLGLLKTQRRAKVATPDFS